MKKQLNEEFKRMQKLAGLIIENQLNKEERTKYNGSDGADIYFTSKPGNPNELLTQYEEGEENGETFPKEEFWKYELNWKYPATRTKDGYIYSSVIDAEKQSDGTWKFYFDIGVISGFKEGEDFVFGPEANYEEDVPNITIG